MNMKTMNMKTMNRIHRIPSLLTAALLVPTFSGALQAADVPVKRPNVLFIAVDDLRPELGCYGNKQVFSPNIDKLAAKGLTFERAYCQQAVCSPSRTSLLTGCRPDTTKVYDLETHFRTTIPDVVTLPEHFKKHGYQVEAYSKIYHGTLNDEASWSVPWWGPSGSSTPSSQKGHKRGPATECSEVPDNTYQDGKTADKVVSRLKELKDIKGKPFFLAVGFLKPHLPFVAPKKYWDLYQPNDIKVAANPSPPKDFPSLAGANWGELRSYSDMPAKGPVSDEDARRLIHGYLASVSYVDAQIGRVLDELDQQGLRNNTIVILWGDHGFKLGEHGMWCKHTNFELDVQSPLIISVPGQQTAGQQTRALTEFVDVYPSLCDLAGLPKPEHLEGTSFVPLVKDPTLPWKKAAFSQYPRGKNTMGYSLRTERYRYTEWLDMRTQGVIARELYDHQSDPAENSNIVDDPAASDPVKKLAALLKEGWRAAKPQP